MLSKFFAIVVLLIFHSTMAHAQTPIKVDFKLVLVDPTDCGPSSNWPDARATAKIKQSDGMTKITIKVIDAIPDSFWSAWVRFPAEISPLSWNGGSRMKAHPLAPVAAIDALAAVTPQGNLDPGVFPEGTGDDGTGSDNVTNGFFTDSNGNGKLKVEVDYPLIKGSIQFQEFDDDLEPVAIGSAPNVSFTLRVVSHCIDQASHGLVPGGEPDRETEEPASPPHQIWFEWSF